MAEHQELRTCIIEKFQAIEKKSKQLRRNYTGLETTDQIVCLMVMSEEEIRNKRFPDNPDIKSYVNRKVTDSELGKILQNFHKKEVHGEIIAMRLDNCMADLKRQYSDTSSDKSGKPYVFIYSHFLPCAGLDKYPYSCAEELAKQALLSKDNFYILVGYSRKFPHTKRSLALGYLHHSSIYALVNVTDKKCEINSEDSFITPQVDIFQKSFHESILKTICCEKCGTDKSSNTIIQNKIDTLIQGYIKKQTSEPRGPLTYLDMKMLQTHFRGEKWLNVCDHDATSQIQRIDECFSNFMEDAYKNYKTILVLGQPLDKEPFWRALETLSIEWNKLYLNCNPQIKELDEPEHQANKRKEHGFQSRHGETTIYKRQKSDETKRC